MDKSIVFDTCMQIRHNYDGCKKGMRPEGGRCVPAKGRLKQEGGGGGKGVNKFAVGAGLVGAGAVAGLAGGIVGGAIDRQRKLKEMNKQKQLPGGDRKQLPGGDRKQLPSAGKDFIEGEYTVVDEPKLPGKKKTEQKLLPDGKKKTEQKLLPAARNRDSAQLVFDSLAFVKSDRSDAETRSITSSICMIIRADGCKKGMRPEGGRCVPAKGRLKQEGGGGGGSNKGLGAVIGTGLAVGGIVGANVYGATRHGQRTIGKAEEWAGNQAAKFGKDFNKGMDESAARVKETEAYKTASPEAQKQYEKNVSGAKGFGNTVRKIGVHNRRFGKKRQAQNQVIV